MVLAELGWEEAVGLISGAIGRWLGYLQQLESMLFGPLVFGQGF